MARHIGRYQRRLLVNRWNLVMSLVTMAFGMAFLLWILVTLFSRGFEALAPTLFTQMTPPTGMVVWDVMTACAKTGKHPGRMERHSARRVLR